MNKKTFSIVLFLFSFSSVFSQQSYSIAEKNIGQNIQKRTDIISTQTITIGNHFVFMDIKNRVGIKIVGENRVKDIMIAGINLHNAKDTFWTFTIDSKFKWKEPYYINDSTILIIANGLHEINLKKGLNWSYYANTEQRVFYKRDSILYSTENPFYKQKISGSFDENKGVPKFDYKQSISNLCADSSGYYFASRDAVFKLDKTGALVWGKELVRDATSSSYLFLKDNYCYILNTGSIRLNSKKNYKGEPYLDCFDRFTGENIFFKRLGKTSRPIINYTIKKEFLYVLYKSGISSYNLKDGSLVSSYFFQNTNMQNEKINSADIPLKITDEEEYKPLKNSTNSIFVVNKNDSIIEFKENLSFHKIYTNNSATIPLLYWKDYAFVYRENDLIVLNSKFKEVAILKNISKNIILIENTLYISNKNILTEINLDRFFR